MRLAVSNIAWEPDEDDAVAAVLRSRGVDAVELAPTRYFADPAAVDDAEAERCRRAWDARGLSIVALQSLLFGRPDLTIFRSAAARSATIAHLRGVLRLAGRLGAGRLVLGSPRNRLLATGMTTDEAMRIATDVFGTLAGPAYDEGAVLCIEPNPPAYGCDFVTTSTEGAALVEAVGHPGFGLHLDLAGMTLAGEDVGHALDAQVLSLRHLHISAPQLGPIESVVVDHAAAARVLRRAAYDQVVSIEMRAGASGTDRTRIERALELVHDAYGLPEVDLVRPIEALHHLVAHSEEI